MINATINNQTGEFEEGCSILEACRSLRIDIPTLCHDDRLKPIGTCRMCLVEVSGKPHPVTACHTALEDGMVILTHSSTIENERRSLLRMLAQDHPGEGLDFRLK